MNTDDDLVRVDAELKRLRGEEAALAARVQTMENAVWRTGVVIGIASLLVGLVVPFLVATDDEGLETVTVLGMAVAAPDSGNGPFRGEASLVGILLWVLAAGTVIVAGVLLGVADRRTSRRGLAASKFLAVLYLVGVIGTWLLVILLAGHFNDSDGADGISWLSPATICFTVGAVIATVMTTKGADLIETSPERR